MQNMEVVYVSGLIASPLPPESEARGRDRDWYKGLFQQAAEGLSGMGVYPLNPLTVDACQDQSCNGAGLGADDSSVMYEHSWECYMRHDIEAIVTNPRCRTILMLPGWSFSRGARVELELTKSLGFDVYLWIVDDGPANPPGFYHQDQFSFPLGRTGDRQPLGKFVPFNVKEAS